VDKVAPGQVLGFPSAFSLTHNHVSGARGEIVADVPSGLSRAPAQGEKNSKFEYYDGLLVFRCRDSRVSDHPWL
jgi:hypothetical protein